MKHWIIAVIMLCFMTTAVGAERKKPVRPLQKDKCPVCGMFVAKYPYFVAEIIFKDGSYAVFDGVKDMLKYYFAIEKYNPKKKRSEIDVIYVTDYYDLKLIDGLKAFYVIGSDVYGPMGRELVPFSNRSDAEEFRKDHQGKALLEFNDITHDAVKGLD
jgi:nitrous oxide reductase accessory protein NosL